MGEDLKKEEPQKPEKLNELAEGKKQKDEYLAGWQRERADFLNYKKEEMERIGELLKYSGEEIVLNLLPILDNLDVAEKKLPDNLKNDENVKGLLMIKNQLEEFLKLQGVEEIKTAGEKFDANFMEAVEKEEEERKGYKINGRLLRPAKVKQAGDED